MTKSTTTKIVTTKTAQPASTKDTGKVHVGGASIRFANTADKGKVHVGGASIRF